MDHTGRGSSGTLYLKSAIAGVIPDPEGHFCAAAPFVSVMKNGSCAIGSFEPCQVGNQAALRSPPDVPRGCLFGAEAAVNVCKNGFDGSVYGLSEFRRPSMQFVSFFIACETDFVLLHAFLLR